MIDSNIDTEAKALEKLSSIYTDLDKSIKKLGEKYSEGTESSAHDLRIYLTNDVRLGSPQAVTLFNFITAVSVSWSFTFQ